MTRSTYLVEAENAALKAALREALDSWESWVDYHARSTDQHPGASYIRDHIARLRRLAE